MMFHNAHTTKLSFYVTVISCDLGVAYVLECMVRKSDVQVTRTRLCELRNVMPCRVRACVRACVRVCVCDCLHCVNETDTLLNLTVFIYNFYTLANCNVLCVC